MDREAQHRSRDTAREALAAQLDHASKTIRCTDGWPTGSRQQPPRQRRSTDAGVLPGNDPRCSATYVPGVIYDPRGRYDPDRNTSKIEIRWISDLETLGSHEL